MKNLQRIGVIILLVFALGPRALGQSEHNVRPRAGIVPDQVTAIRIAEAVLIPIYGQEQIKAERPFTAKLNTNTWIVMGYIPPGVDGGVAEVWIDKRDGKILRVTHGK
ncbi:MAG TPA: YbbC/YhhH family protein [Rhizomicrobium sp.]